MIDWKEQLQLYREAENFDAATLWLEKIIREDPDNVDARIFMNDLMLHILIDPHSWDLYRPHTRDAMLNYLYHKARTQDYEKLALQYYNKSTTAFGNNPKYLYFTAITISLAPWIFGDANIIEAMSDLMWEKARQLDPHSPLLNGNRSDYEALNASSEKELFTYKQHIIEENKRILGTMGPAGEFILQGKENRFNEYLEAFRKKHKIENH